MANNTTSPSRPVTLECADGPYRGFVVTLRPGQTRVRVRDREVAMEPAWYTLEQRASERLLVWDAPAQRDAEI